MNSMATRERLGVTLAMVGVAALSAGAATLEQRLRPNARDAWLPFQRSYLELEPPDRATYASLREGLMDLETSRVTDGTWPTPESLRAAGVPGFADDTLSWSLHRAGSSVNYEGRSTVDGGVSFLVLLLEPEPRPPGQLAEAPPPEDEEHHTLSDGTAIHVSVWSTRERSAQAPVATPFPQVEGWTQRLVRPREEEGR